MAPPSRIIVDHKLQSLKPLLHKRVFACDCDAIFENVTWPVQHFEFLAMFSAIFSGVASPVRKWLHLQFSPRAGHPTIFKKKNSITIAHVATAL